jgi:hypothetical protein
MLRRMMIASVFCLCLWGVSNAQPGAAQKAAVDAALDAAKEWKLEKLEVGWDKGPVVKGGVTRDRDGGCTPRDRDPIDRDPIDRGPRDRDPIDRGPRDRDPIDRGPRDRDPIDRRPRDRDPVDRRPRDRDPSDRDKPVGGRKDIL